MLVLNAQAGMLALVWVPGLYTVQLISLALCGRHLAHEISAAHLNTGARERTRHSALLNGGLYVWSVLDDEYIAGSCCG